MPGSDNVEKGGIDLKAVAFFAGITGMAMLGGFSLTLGMAKKKDPAMFVKRVQALKGAEFESGASLASRALDRATLYTVAGFTLFNVLVWKTVGANDFTEFRQKVGSVLPRLSPTTPPQTRTEFDGVRDLLTYIIQLDEEKKSAEEKSLQSFEVEK